MNNLHTLAQKRAEKKTEYTSFRYLVINNMFYHVIWVALCRF